MVRLTPIRLQEGTPERRVLRSLSSGQHRDSAILSTSGEMELVVRTVGQLHCEARRPMMDPPTGCSVTTRSGAWRGLMQEGAAPKEPPLTYVTDLAYSSPGSGLSLFQISCATRQDPSGCLRHVTRYFPASWIGSPSAFGVKLIT